MTTSLPPLPPPLPPPHPSQDSEQTALRILELKNQMRSLEVAALLAIFVPVFGGFYASPITGFGMVVASLVFGGAAAATQHGFFLFWLVVAYFISIFSAVKQARLHNEEVLKEARQQIKFP